MRMARGSRLVNRTEVAHANTPFSVVVLRAVRSVLVGAHRLAVPPGHRVNDDHEFIHFYCCALRCCFHLLQYSRTNNPTRAAFERAVAAVEHGKHCLAFGSGMAATVAVLHLLKSGDHVVCIDDVYGGTQRYFRRIAAPNYGITFDFVDYTAPGELERAVKANPKTKLVWLETPTNPTLKISDIAEAARIAHENGALLAVDNTFMSPYFQRPLDLGADVVIHSVTKYSECHLHGNAYRRGCS